MSTCRDCKGEVRFVLISEVDGERQWSPPLEPKRRAFFRRPERGGKPFATEYVLTEVFTLHDCPQREAMKEREQKVFAHRQSRARASEAAWVEALTRACPDCEQPTGERCINMADRRYRRPEPRITRWPHPSRLPSDWTVPEPD